MRDQEHKAPDFTNRSSQAFLHRRIAKRHAVSRNFVEAITHHEASVQLVEALLRDWPPCHDGSKHSIPSQNATSSDAAPKPTSDPAALFRSYHPSVPCSCSSSADLTAHSSRTVFLDSEKHSSGPNYAQLQRSPTQRDVSHRLRMLLAAGLHDLAQIHSFLGDLDSARQNLGKAIHVLESSAATEEKVKVYFQGLLKILRSRHARESEKRNLVGKQIRQQQNGNHANSQHKSSAMNTQAQCAAQASAVTKSDDVLGRARLQKGAQASSASCLHQKDTPGRMTGEFAASKLLPSTSGSLCKPTRSGRNALEDVQEDSSMVAATRKLSEKVVGPLCLAKHVRRVTARADEASLTTCGQPNRTNPQAAKSKKDSHEPRTIPNQLHQNYECLLTGIPSAELCRFLSSSESDDEGGRQINRIASERVRGPRRDSTCDPLPLSHSSLPAAVTPPSQERSVTRSVSARAAFQEADRVRVTTPSSTAASAALTCHFSGFADILQWRRAADGAVPAEASCVENSSNSNSDFGTVARHAPGSRRGSGVTFESTQHTTVVRTVEKCRCACLVSFYEDNTWQVCVCPTPTTPDRSHLSSTRERPLREKLPCELRLTGKVDALASSVRHAVVAEAPWSAATDVTQDVVSTEAETISEKSCCGAEEFCAGEAGAQSENPQPSATDVPCEGLKSNYRMKWPII